MVAYGKCGCTNRIGLPAVGAQTEQPAAGSAYIEISAPVGRFGHNLPNDTVTVQDALNRVPPGQGRATPPLDVEGSCGPKTIKAIQEFQLKHFGWGGADGLVEPGKQTIAKLNELLGSGRFGFSSPAAGTAPPRRKSDVRYWNDFVWGIELAKWLIVTSEINLVAAEPYVENSTGSSDFLKLRNQQMHHLNKHFKIDSLPSNPLKRKAFNLVRKVFLRMREVLNQPGRPSGPGGWNIFEMDTTADPAYAFTNYGGYFRKGQFVYKKHEETRKEVRIRADAIYLTELFHREWAALGQAPIHIHELAHYVGHPEFIGDYAYNFDRGKIDKLPANLALLNAESYRNFAAAYGLRNPYGSVIP